MKHDAWLDYVPFPLTVTAIAGWASAIAKFAATWFEPSLASHIAHIADMTGLIATIIGLPLLFLFFIHRRRLYAYSSDEFFGLWWDWDYTLLGRPHRLRASCRVCREPIVFSQNLIIRLLGTDNHLCDVCGHDTYSRTKEKIPRQDVYSEVLRRINEKRKRA